MNFSRRAAILGATALPLNRIVKGQSRPKFVAVGSANRNYGGLPNEDGVVEFDASVDAPPAEQKKVLQDSIEHLKVEFRGPARLCSPRLSTTRVNPPHGAINCIGMNEKGEMSAVSTTGGMAWKLAGRVGDSPIIGGAGSTGRGEENLRHGMAPPEAALDALKRVAKNFGRDEKRLAGADIQFYMVWKDGGYCGASLWNKSSVSARQGAQMAVCTKGSGRHEDCVYLLERKG